MQTFLEKRCNDRGAQCTAVKNPKGQATKIALANLCMSRQHCIVTLQILTVCFLAGGEGIREARTLFRSWLKDYLAKETAVQCPSS
jgi:hypothetical protein